MLQEEQRIQKASRWYLKEQLNFDIQMIRFRYRSIRPHFVGTRGCELGPAEGQMTRFLLDDFSSLTVVDAAADLLQKIPPDPKLIKVHSLFEDYIPDSQFDTIVMEHILEHVELPAKLLATAANWFPPGQSGRLIVGVPNAHSIHRLAAVRMGLLQTPAELNARDISLGHRRVYTIDELCRDVEAAGLRVVTTGGVFLKPLSNGQIESHWTEDMIEAFFELGKDFPEHTAEIYVVAER